MHSLHYFDYNATCPPIREALMAMQEVAENASGNPSSLHWSGRAARHALDNARDSIAAFCDVEPGAVVFTSGGTESNNLAIHGCLTGQSLGRIVVSAIEHPSVLESVKQWQDQGWDVAYIRPDQAGVIQAEAVAEALTLDTRLVCLMAANNETGAIQPVMEVGALCHERRIPFLVDAVQAMGKIAVDMRAWQADFVSLSAHKIGGSRGIGALLVRKGTSIHAWMCGGGQERGRRSGTENVAGAAGFAAAIGVHDFSPVQTVRDAFETHLRQTLPDVHIFSETTTRIANTSMFYIPRMEGETLLMQLDLAGFAVASGSACSSGKRNPSHVLQAMGYSHDMALGSIRISFGPDSRSEDAMVLVETLAKVRHRLLSMAGAI